MAQMQNDLFNDLQVYRAQRFDGLVDENMLYNAYQLEPHKVNTVLSYVFGSMDSTSPLSMITGAIGRTMTIESNQYEWKLMVESDEPLTIQAAYTLGSAVDTTSSSTDTPGINGTPIQIWVDRRAYGPGALLEFDDNNYQVRVMGEPYQDGHQWVYTLQVADGDPASYISPFLLASGKQVSRLGSAYEEGSDEADIISYQSPVMFRNHLTTMRLKYDITGSAYSDVMVVEMRDPKTKKSSRYWADLQEWEAYRQWYKNVDYQLIYQKYNANSVGRIPLKGTNGRPVFLGAGLQQQIAASNKLKYTKLTLTLLEEFLYKLAYNVRGMGERKYMALSGEMGIKELDRVLREKAATYTLIDTSFVTGSGQNLTFGGQFTTYKMLNGVELTIKHWPLLDDTYHFRKLHPVSGYPVESYKMFFLNIGATSDGGPNIMKVTRKGREFVLWATGGSVVPGQGYGTSVSTVRSNSKDGFTVQFLGDSGIMVKNPTACGILELNVEG